MKFARRKADRLARWHVRAGTYAVAVIEWQKTTLELPASIRVRDETGRTALLAAETARLSLLATREPLGREAAELGIDGQLPLPVWPERQAM